MAKFAIYDKRYGMRDKKINQFFLNDYIYYKNAWTRFFVFIGCMVALFFYWLHKIVIDQIDIFAIDYRLALVQNLTFVGAVMFLYTLVSTKKAASSYRDAMRRQNNYFMLLNKLDKHGYADLKQSL